MCVFCGIIEGTVASSVVYEDEKILAFMDLHQANPGHVLIIPKLHVEKIYECPHDLAAALFPVVVKVSRAVQEAFHPDGISIIQSNGAAAMQEVPHLHIHVIPRHHRDGVLRFYTKNVPDITPRMQLDEWAIQIRNQIPEEDE
jgi:histidine triad (HIT) family protein